MLSRGRLGRVPDMTPARTGESVAQSMSFGSLSIAFDDRVLRPRSWTAGQSTWAADLLLDAPARNGPGAVLELCAGAGHIGLLALAMARARADAPSLVPSLVTVDLNPVACEYTRQNAAAAGLGDDVEVREGHIDNALRTGERFVLVIADPPWIPRADTVRFPDDPLLAIDGGDSGLDVALACLRVAQAHLVEGGSMVLQLGTLGQVENVREWLTAEGSALVVDEVRAGERGVLVRLRTGSRRPVSRRPGPE